MTVRASKLLKFYELNLCPTLLGLSFIICNWSGSQELAVRCRSRPSPSLSPCPSPLRAPMQEKKVEDNQEK